MLVLSMTTVQTSSAASDVYVNSSGNDGNSGSSYSPYQTISNGISRVDNRGTVHLTKGTFNHDISSGHSDYGITIAKNVTIQGAGSNQTIIDAKGLNNIFTINSGNITIRDLTIQNGNALKGGAINNLYGNLTIINCIIINNIATNNGGAIYNSGKLNITGSTFTNNTVTNGYGSTIFNHNGTVEMHYNTILGTKTNTIYSDSGVVNAQNNWWGSNSDPGTELEDFDDINNWTPISGATTSTNTINGDVGIKVSGSNGTYPGIVKNVKYNFYGVAPSLQLWLYLDNNSDYDVLTRPSNLIDIGIDFLSNTDGKYYEAFLIKSQLHKGLNYDVIPQTLFKSYGGMTWNDTISSVQIRLFYETGLALNVTFLEIKNNMPSTPRVVLTFDDGYESVFDTAFPIMQQYGIKGTVYVNMGLIGNQGMMTLQQLHTLYDAGWTIASHTPNHTDLTTLTNISDVKTILQVGIDWLKNNGFDRGAYHFALPWGKYNDMILQAMREVGIKTDRTVLLRMTGTPTDDLLQISQEGPYGYDDTGAGHYTTLIDAEQFIIDAIQSNASIFVMMHEIIAVPLNTSSWDTANFSAWMAYISQTGIKTQTVDQWYADVSGLTFSPVNYSPWLILNETASVNPVQKSGVSTITADFTHNSNGEDTSSGGHIPDGLTVNFSSDTLGSVNPSSSKTVNGKATTTFTAGSNTGTSNVQASANNQITNLSLIISGPVVPISVVSSDPTNGGVNVAPNKVITITFNQPIKAGSTYNNIKMVNINDNSDKPITTSISGNVLTITPTYNWLQKSTYQLTLPINSITDISGNGLTSAFIMSFTCNLVPTSIVVNQTTGFKGDIVNLTATLKDNNSLPLSGKTVNFSVNGTSVGQAITDASGIATYAYTILQNGGTYNILAEFLQDGIYATTNSTNILTVPFTPTALVVDPVNGFKGDKVNLIATLKDTHSNLPIEGKTVNFSVNGTPVGHAITDASGIATYAYTILQNGGTYNILAEFLQDSIYATSNNTNTLTIPFTPTALVVDPVNGFKGDKVNLIATLKDTHSNLPIEGKTVNFSVNGTPVGHAITDASGIATYAYTILQNGGTYNILAEFLQDSIYATSNNTNTLTVPFTPTALVVDPANGFKGDKVNLIATLTDTHSNIPIEGKTVNFSVNGTPVGHAITDASGIATYAYTILQNEGTYNILAEFLQDSIYATSNNTNTLTVPFTPTALVVDPVNGFKGDKVNLIATLTDTHSNIPIEGKTIQFSVNGTPVGQATTNASGIATYVYTILQNSGTYTILAEFLQDTTYTASTNTNNLKVALTPTSLIINPVIGFKGDKVNLIATLTDTHSNIPVSGKTIQFSVNGTPVGQSITDAFGIATYAYTISQNGGTYAILAEFLQDITYTASTNTNNLKVALTPTTLVTIPASGVKGDKVNLIATLTDTHSNIPLSGKIVKFSIDGTSVGQAITDSSGIAILPYNIVQSSGTYTILAEFLQDITYGASSNTNSLGVDHITTALIVNSATGYKADKVNLIATLTDTQKNVPVSGKTIQFSVNGTPVGQSITNASGIATYAYTILQNSGTYTILAEFLQDTTYTASTNTNNLAVTMTPTVLSVYPAIGYKGSKVNLIAKLTDNHSNVPISGKIIKFSVYGTTVGQATTNTSGIATYAYTISQNSGTYKILAEFLQDATYAACNSTNNCVVDNTAPTATATPTGSTSNTSKTVTLKMSESGIIYYTLNGTNPTTSSSKYSAPLSITSTKTLRYIAVDLAGNKSPIYSQTYTIDKTAPKVLLTSPVNNANGVSLTSSINIKFSENIVAGTNYSKIYVKNLTTGKISAISKTISGNTLTIQMTKSRLHGNTYQVYIPAGAIKDKYGNITTTAYTFKFKTG